jgi:hypothetical protein
VDEGTPESFPLGFDGFDGFGISILGRVTIGPEAVRQVHRAGDVEGEMEVSEGQVGGGYGRDEPCGAVDVEVEGGGRVDDFDELEIAIGLGQLENVLCISRDSRLSAAQEQRHYLPAILHALPICVIPRLTDTLSSAVGLKVGMWSWRRAAHACQFIISEANMLHASVGVENQGVDLTPDLERESAEERGVDLWVWIAVGEAS